MSDEYREQLQKKVQAKPQWGGTGFRQTAMVWQLVDRVGATSLLDYGCGNGSLKVALSQTRPSARTLISEFDPARPGKDSAPYGVYDVVTCIDVMEHVEEEYVDAVLADIARLTGRGAYFLVSLTKAIHKLPDGRNAHLTVKPQAWWEEQMDKHFSEVTILRSKSTWFTCEAKP